MLMPGSGLSKVPDVNIFELTRVELGCHGNTCTRKK